jgi:diphosphomevalonate decarboxylase
MFKGSARAHTNIALIKYWGKENKTLIIPKNSSLSLTLDAFYTETTVTFDKQNPIDRFILNGELQDFAASKKVFGFLALVREKSGCSLFATVESQNFVPTAAGLASSASGMAALAGACNEALHMGLSDIELSRLARRGSGSSCRSIYGGFAEWIKGESDETSYAVAIDSQGWDKELGMIFILINDRPKDISSRDGMERTVATSSFYPGWLETAPQDLMTAETAIATKDFEKLGEVTEASALKMHGATLAAVPPFTYWSPDSLKAMDLVRTIRKNGLPCYFTMDAGPNVKVLVQKENQAAVYEKLAEIFGKNQLVMANSGPGLEILK